MMTTPIALDATMTREQLLAFVAGRRVVLSVSGGKDSAAASLYLRERGIEHTRVFADTGWEHALTYEYLRGPLTEALGPIVEVRGERTFVQLVRHKRIFPDRTKRFCTTELKMKPIRAYVDSLDEDVLNVVGIRADESEARSKLTFTEWSDFFDCEVWRPLLRWSVDDVIAIHKRHGLVPNPLYLKGASRVGCWPCIHARKEEIRLVADIDPARIDEIRALETEVTEDARTAHANFGEALTWERALFSGRELREEPCKACVDVAPGQLTTAVCEACNGTRVVTREAHFPMRIDDAVEWSRTSRGGRQMLLLNQEEPGCVRWGMCESAPGKP